MSFTTKKVQSASHGMSFIKGATLFFLGTSCVLFAVRAFDITPSIPNAVQYIQQIFLTSDGGNGTPSITLNGINGSIQSTSVTATTINGTTVNGTNVIATTISGTNIKGGTITGSTICLGTDGCRSTWPTGGAATTPGGSTGNIQFNGGTGFSGASTLAWTGGALTISGNIQLQNSGWIKAGIQSQLIRLDATNGYVGIAGVINPSSELDVGGGTVTAGKYLYNSDKRLKTDITSLTDPLTKILSLNGYLFTWKKTGAKDMGVIAQEVEKVFPEIVHTNNEGYKSVEYGNLVAPLIEAIKALNTKIDAQAKEIAALKTKK